MEFRPFQNYLMKKIIDVCVKHEISHIIYRDKNKHNRIDHINIICDSNEYNELFKLNKYVHGCNHVFFNITNGMLNIVVKG